MKHSSEFKQCVVCLHRNLFLANNILFYIFICVMTHIYVYTHTLTCTVSFLCLQFIKV